MKKWIRFKLVFVVVITTVVLESCNEKSVTTSKEVALNTMPVNKEEQKAANKALSEEFKKYWYAGNAEITSYKLKQARYGEVREGTSVLIYVTEPFLPEVQVKADRSNKTNIPVLKLNATKKYLTGIYPYAIMSSTFYPVYDNQHAIKTSLSVQEWCGHVYSQLNNRAEFEFTSHSYFEGEADQSFKLDKAILENEIWNKIRIDPSALPIGEINIIPSLEFFRTKHVAIKAFPATASLTTSNGISTYTVDYGEDFRKLTIDFTTAFPYTIESWKEEFKSGFGANAKMLASTGTKIKRLKTPYWRQNSNKFVALRDSLGL